MTFMVFNENQLNNKEFLEKNKSIMQDIINEDRFREAYDLSKNLEKSIDAIKDFKEKNYELYREYKNIIIKLKWIGLPIMIEDNVVHMFRYYFSDIFKIPDYDIWAKLRIVLLSMIIFDDRDKFKKQLSNALMDNQQTITSQRLIIDNQKRSPKVSNWLKDYNKTLGTGVIDKLARTQYLIDGKNIRNLSQEEKNKIKILFDLYEKLKLSSHTIEGLEEDIPVDEDNMKGTIRAGVFEPYKEMEKKFSQIIFGDLSAKDSTDKSKVNLDELQKMVSQYPAGSLERKAIEEEINKVKR